ncbi:cbb3-type cytochrome oxidase assembly protein CcoS [Cohaesibacter haloalkalitolerans]|uniref:cbb3-type cytochrome oxidase assembly protein CcoS n=1 Tax=Cohaesibacter haloalkalitolerans TaxID=1162980 RepID=UPI000E653D8E
MNVLFFLIPIALGLGALGLIAFLWSLKSNQYEDLQGAAYRILDDSDLEPEEQARILSAKGTRKGRDGLKEG